MVVGKGIFSTRRQAVMAKMRRDANHNQRVENRDVKCHLLQTAITTYSSKFIGCMVLEEPLNCRQTNKFVKHMYSKLI